MKKEQGFIAQVLVVLILLVGLGVGLYLTRHPTVFKPKAYEQNPQSTDSLINKVREIEDQYEKIDKGEFQSDRSVKLPVVVFEDTNKNGIKDSEVGIPNIKVKAIAAFKITRIERPEAVIAPEPTPQVRNIYLPLEGNTDSSGTFEFDWLGPGTMVRGDVTYKADLEEIIVWLGNHVADPPPYGWSKTSENSLLVGIYSNNFSDSLTKALNINPTGDTILESSDFPLIGAQKIVGKVIYDLGIYGQEPQPGISILLDASRADNATKRLYTTASKEDGTFEIDNLPPLSRYRIKAAAPCPWKVRTPPYEGLTLGAAGNPSYEFLVTYSQYDSCISE